MILIIDNYDSFTYNIVHALERIGNEEVKVVRSKETTIQEIEALSPSRIVLGPGPGTPADAGICIAAVRHFAGRLPILGICLGHQAIGAAYGANIVQAKRICHGVLDEISLDGRGLFRITGKKGDFTRYHSLVIEEASLSEDFEITARSKDGDIMGIRHKSLFIEGIQFHPESIASLQGDDVFKAFLNYRSNAFAAADYLNQILAGKDLTQEQAALFMENLTDGILDERITAAILTALAAKGPAASELAGCASVLCHKKTPLAVDGNKVAEIVGTGGDGKGSFNISSLSAIVASSCGQPMAKHGNRAVSSKSGSADFYEAIGVKIDNTPEKTAELVKRTDFAFLMAPIYHSAMRFAGPVRKALGIKTIMNILGPLSNPAGAAYQLLGVYGKELLVPVAKASKALGSKRVMVITSQDGFDEISPCALTYVYVIDEDWKEREYTIDPEDYGIPAIPVEELSGGTGRDNAQLGMDVLKGCGRKGILEAICLNAGAVLYISRKVDSLKEGYKRAKEAIQSGKALAKLEEVKAVSNSL